MTPTLYKLVKEVLDDLPRALREAREAAGLRQWELAEILKSNQAAISRFELGYQCQTDMEMKVVCWLAKQK